MIDGFFLFFLLEQNIIFPLFVFNVIVMFSIWVIVLPHEILFSNINEALEKTRSVTGGLLECRVKYNRDNIKVKLRTRRRLYTLVLTLDNTGVNDFDSLKNIVDEFLSKIECPSKVMVQ